MLNEIYFFAKFINIKPNKYIMRIRKAKLEDSKSMALLCQNTIKYVNSKDYNKSQITAWLTKNTTKHMRNNFPLVNKSIFVMLDNNRVIGLVSAKLDKQEISGLYVNQKHIGMKIGTKLLHKIETHFLSIGITNIKLYSTLTAFNFYKSQGYKKIKNVIKIIEGVPITTVLMTKNLAKK